MVSVRAALAPFAVFLALAGVFLWQPLLTGKAFLPTDLAFRYDQMWGARSAGRPASEIAQNPILADVSDYYHPYRAFAMRELQSGRLPLWNPFILTGMPFFASAQPALLDPVNLAALPLDPISYWTFAAWLRLALMGAFTFGFARALGRSPLAAGAAGTVFMLCGFVVVWLNYPMVNSLVWMPALFWAGTRLLESGARRHVAATSAAVAGVLFGGHPQTQFLIGLVWAGYMLHGLARLRRSRPSRFPRRLVAAAGAVALGAALSAVQWLPFLQFLFASHAFRARQEPLAPFSAAESAMRLAVLLLPDVSGRIHLEDYWLPSFMNFNEQTGYVGLAAAALACVGFRAARRSGGEDASRAAYFAAAGLIAALLAIRAPVFHLVKTLPLFDVGHGVRWLLVWSFFAALLAGRGVDALRAADPKALRAAGRAFVGVAAIGSFALLALWLWLDALPGSRTLDLSMRGQTVAPQAGALASLLDPRRMLVPQPLVALLAAGAVLLAAARAGTGGGRRRAAAAALCGVLYADLWLFGSTYNPVTPRSDVFPETPTIRLLRERLGHDRLMAGGDLLRPNVAMIFGFRDLRGYEDVIDDTFDRLFGETLARLAGQQWLSRASLTDEDVRLLDVAAVRFFLTVVPLRGPEPLPYRRIAVRELVGTYESERALPRAHAVLGARVVPDLAAARAVLLDPAFDGRHEVVLTGDGASRPAPLEPEPALVRWRVDQPDLVVLEAELPAPGWVVLADVYDPAWLAWVDDRPAPVLRANGAFRAVELPAGRHEVRFAYQPRGVRAGAALSLAALASLLLLPILPRLRAGA